MNGESGRVSWKAYYVYYVFTSHEYYQHVLTVNHTLSNLLGVLFTYKWLLLYFHNFPGIWLFKLHITCSKSTKKPDILCHYHNHNNNFLYQMGQVVVLRFHYNFIIIFMCKPFDIWTWKKHLFLDISATNIDTLIPLLYKCVVTCSVEVFSLLYQPLPHLRSNLFIISETFTIKVVFWWTKQMEVTRGQVQAGRRMFKKFPL
jgi:hypothetical protein